MPDSGADRNPVEILAEEFLERQRLGERPSLAEYVGRHPELAEEIRELFPLMLEMEGVRPEAEGTASRPVPGPDAAPAAPAPRRLGDYRIVREVGRGGMGVVYEAEQESLGRRVALKVLLPALVTPQQVRRFDREARAAGRLHHTNIVPVFGVGEQDGTYYYVMQYIPGQPLDEVLRELRRLKERGGGPEPRGRPGPEAGRPSAAAPSAVDVARSLWTGRPGPTTGLDPTTPDLPSTEATGPDGEAPTVSVSAGPMPMSPEAPAPSGSNPLTAPSGPSQAHREYARAVARIGVQVAAALEYAAGQGIVHRDVKPSNLLLDQRGTAWVTDFGLAKAAGQDDITHTGDLVGTLRYMAPERFRGEADRRSDIYALGLSLYEMLALRPAFDEADRGRLIAQITRAEPPRLAKLDPTIHRDLATIVHKAMAHDPSDRYQSADDLAADLSRFLEDRPIQARRPGRLEVTWRWCRRNPAVASLLALVAMLLVGGTAASSVAAFRYNRLAGSESEARQEADRRATEAQAVVDFFVNDMLAEAAPAKTQGREVTVQDVLARADAAIAGKFAGQPLVEASIRHTMAQTYEGLAQFEKAETHARRARELRSEQLGLEHPETLQATQSLGGVLEKQSQSEAKRREALSLLEPLLAVQRRVLGPEHPETLKTMKMIGHVLVWDRPEEARAIFERLLPILARVLGPDDRMTLSTRIGIARTLGPLGKIEQIEDHYRAAYEGLLRILGPDHPVVIRTKFMLANAIAAQERLPEARGLLEQVVEANRRVMGPMHARTLSAMIRLYGVLLAEGKREEALALIERVTGPSGPEGPKLPPGLLNDLAWALVAHADPEGRDPRRALALAKAAVEESPKHAHYRNTLGVAQYRAEDWAGTITSLEESNRLGQDKVFGYNGFFLAMAHFQLGHTEEARQFYDRSVDWLERCKPQDAELRRFRIEAASLLGLPAPSAGSEATPRPKLSDPSIPSP